jgi:serine/threonine-protein kinase
VAEGRGEVRLRLRYRPRLLLPALCLLPAAVFGQLPKPAATAMPAGGSAAAKAPAAAAPLSNPVDGAELVAIPSGEFRMGSEEGDEDEKPVHPVKLKGFRVYKTEVTNAQYARFLAATRYREPLFWKEERFNKPKQPVVGVDWYDAVAYGQWAHARLPTEAEWEYAARGTDGREFPWAESGRRRRGGGDGGKEEVKRAVMDLPFNSGKPEEVGSMPDGASFFGVLDMAGNVWEWCADWYDRTYYARSPRENPPGPTEGRQKLLRGGSWGYPSNVRSAYRFPERPTFRSNYVGFRCVQDSP